MRKNGEAHYEKSSLSACSLVLAAVLSGCGLIRIEEEERKRLIIQWWNARIFLRLWMRSE